MTHRTVGDGSPGPISLGGVQFYDWDGEPVPYGADIISSHKL